MTDLLDTLAAVRRLLRAADPDLRRAVAAELRLLLASIDDTVESGSHV